MEKPTWATFFFVLFASIGLLAVAGLPHSQADAIARTIIITGVAYYFTRGVRKMENQ